MNIKTLLIKRGMSQKQLAQSIGVSRSYMSLIVNERREPTLRVLRRIARVLDVSVSELINGK